jgi:methylglutaconyl-CoA hydratase
MAYQSILTEVDRGVGILTLNRADRHNAFDDLMIEEIADAIAALNEEPAVRVIVISSTGKSFSAGADLNWMKRMAGYSAEENLRDATAMAEMFHRIATSPKPVIARVQGAAFGGGVGLVAAADIAVGCFDAEFALTEVKLGLIPAVISPYVIATIGERYARRFFLSAERFSAAEAYRLGLLHEIVADSEALDEAVGELVEHVLKNSPQAMAESKALIAAVAWKPVSPFVIADTAQRITRQRASTEGREGMAAFLEKRKPNWWPR